MADVRRFQERSEVMRKSQFRLSDLIEIIQFRSMY
jgi:hypothetical protein